MIWKNKDRWWFAQNQENKHNAHHKTMLSQTSSALQVGLNYTAKHIGYPHHAQRFLTYICRFMVLFVFGDLLAYLYFSGPVFMGVGFWNRMSLTQICATQTNLAADYWQLHLADCTTMVEELFQTFVDNVTVGVMATLMAVYWRTLASFCLEKISPHITTAIRWCLGLYGKIAKKMDKHH